MIAGLGYAAGLYHGTLQTMSLWRDFSSAARDGDMRRLLSADELLANGEVDLARRKLSAVALSDYLALEDDAAGHLLPATEGMLLSIGDTRRYVERYCASEAAAFHLHSDATVCKADQFRRSNNALEQTRGE